MVAIIVRIKRPSTNNPKGMPAGEKRPKPLTKKEKCKTDNTPTLGSRKIQTSKAKINGSAIKNPALATCPFLMIKPMIAANSKKPISGTISLVYLFSLIVNKDARINIYHRLKETSNVCVFPTVF